MYWNRDTLQTNTECGAVVRDVPFVYTTLLDIFERQRLHGEGGEGHDCRSRGTNASKEETDTTITSVLSDNSSVAPVCCGHPPEGKEESQTGKCFDDGRGPVKTLSGRLARKLQRSASLVNAGFSKQIQTVLDAATVDR